MAFPNTVGSQGLPGEVYARTPQIRLSHTLIPKAFGNSDSLQETANSVDGVARQHLLPRK